ncbi:hypothetical protein GCM10027034_12710 [Ramlibacter solisilvae]|uniref:Uncharacterized protein n=1 Tax=Ramlibacter tataouinensis TaxID=94132 RepID=A0A127JX49_9BURK|nr:hypothetical protein [Ramlibacter tataouinensis]AMO24459.1 hypothetical protein UC35_18475 [Ramlibacter tataouinensis]
METRTRIVIAALAAAAALASLPAAAHTSIGVQIGVPAYAQPVYAQPVYAQPVYPQPVYVRPAPVVVYPAVPANRAWAHGYWQGNGYAGVPQRTAYVRGDRDHDGVPNRWDRAPNNPYRY